MNFHLSIKFIPNRKFTNGNITLIGRREKLKMKEQCDEMLKQYDISGCTDFSVGLKSEHPVAVNPPTHPNLNFVTDLNLLFQRKKLKIRDGISVYRYIG